MADDSPTDATSADPDAGFLRAITDEPEEDAHRLVYADWLDENGQGERAEFIRAQVALERLPASDPCRGELHRRAQELLDQHRDAWLSQLPKVRGVVWHRFWRGFVGGADVQAWKYYRRHADALFAAAPVQFLRVFGISASSAANLAASAYLERLVGLDLIDASLGDEGAEALAASLYLGRLHRLIVIGPHPSCIVPGSQRPRIGDAGALALAASPHLGQLELLDLRFNAIGPEAAEALTRRFGQAVRL